LKWGLATWVAACFDGLWAWFWRLLGLTVVVAAMWAWWKNLQIGKSSPAHFPLDRPYLFTVWLFCQQSIQVTLARWFGRIYGKFINRLLTEKNRMGKERNNG
jgi:hypothetical protein